MGVVVGGTEDFAEEEGEGVGVEVVLAGVDVGGDKATLGEGVVADVAFGNHNKTTDTTWVLTIQLPYLDHLWLRDGVHIHLERNFGQEPGKVRFISE